MLRTTYLDLTDIFHFMRYAKNVTGIQRATLLIIENLLTKNPDKSFRFIAYHPVFHTMVEFDGTWFQRARGSAPEDFIRNFSLKANAAFFKSVMRWVLGRSQKAAGASKWRKPHPQSADSICVLGNYWGHPGLFRYLRRQAARGVNIEVLIYDLIPLLYPEFSPRSFNRLYRKKLWGLNEFVSRYFAISLCTATDLDQYLLALRKRTSAPIVTILLAQEFPEWKGKAGYEDNIRPQIQGLSAVSFVLCIGTIEQRKNPLTLLRTWQRLYQQLGPETPKLVFAGRNGWHIDEFEATLKKTNNLEGHVIQVGDANDAELAHMLRSCLFTTYPSFYEGWGLPIGEALWFGKTCVASSTSSMPEVGGELCIYADPHDIEAVYQAIRSLIDRPKLRQELEVRISNTKLRTWADVAEDLARALKP